MICSRCVLPDSFPGIRFDDVGVCNYCHQGESRISRLSIEKAKYLQKFLNLIAQLKEPSDTQPGICSGLSDHLNQPNHFTQLSRFSYDALMAYSGGKDSTYTLKLLRRNFNLRVLAITFNHGFVSEQALKNIHTVMRTLGVDHLMVSPNPQMLCRAFRESARSDLYPLKTLERASSICNTCMNLVKSILLKTSIEMGIPLIVYGWSPGQAPIQSSVMKWNSSMVRQTQDAMAMSLDAIMGEDLRTFKLTERHFKLLEWESENFGGTFLYNIHPLAFLEYHEEKILEETRGLGWQDPKDTDSNSTNCLLNGFATQVHQERHGFHPYAFEIAGLVRTGVMTREAGLAKLSAPPDQKIIQEVKNKLGLKP
jgi:tRNA(Ile)-lysidine synthase TilS/MesJ